MCLEYLTNKVEDGALEIEGRGYKVFVVSNSPFLEKKERRLLGPFYTPFKAAAEGGYRLDEWITDILGQRIKVEFLGQRIKVEFEADKTYLSGFHIFEELEDAQEFCKLARMYVSDQTFVVHEVEYRKVTATGTQSAEPGGPQLKVVVALEMKIGKQVVKQISLKCELSMTAIFPLTSVT